MQGSSQEHHQEGCSCREDQGGDEPGIEIQTGSPEVNEDEQPSSSGSLPENCPQPNFFRRIYSLKLLGKCHNF